MKLTVKRIDWTIGLQGKNNESTQEIEINAKGNYCILSKSYDKQITKGIFKKKILTVNVTEETFAIQVNNIEKNSIQFSVDKNTDRLKPINVKESSNYILKTNEILKFGTQTEGAGTTLEFSLKSEEVRSFDEIDELNTNSKLKYKLGEGDMNILKENNEVCDPLKNFTSMDYYLPNMSESTRVLKFYGFPTDEDSFCLASYSTKASEDNVFGIKVGTNINQVKTKLEKFGYEKVEELKFKKGVVDISLECQEISDLPKQKQDEYMLLCSKERENLLTDEDKVLLGKYEDYKHTICEIEVSLESKYLGNRIY